MKSTLTVLTLALFSFTTFAATPISFNVHGFWYRGRAPEKKIAYIGDVNARTGTSASVEDIVIDIERNTCRSIYVQASVQAMLRVFGPSRKISIKKIELGEEAVVDFETRPCVFSWRGGRTGRVCYEDICVSNL